MNTQTDKKQTDKKQTDKKQTEKIQTGKNQNIFLFLLKFLPGARLYFFLALVFVILSVFFELVNPRLIGFIVDVITGETAGIPKFLHNIIQRLGGREVILSNPLIPALAIITVGLLGAITRYLFALFNNAGSEKLVQSMRNGLFSHILKLPLSWHDLNPTGDIIQRCTSDVEVTRGFLTEQLSSFIRIILLIVLALFFMSGIHVKLTIISVAFFPVIIIYSVVFRGRLEDAFEELDREEGNLSAMAQENLSGVRVVRAFGMESYEKERFESKNSFYTGLWVTMLKLLSLMWSLNDFFSGLQVLSILCVGSWFAIKGELSAGSLVSFVTYNAILSIPIRNLGRLIADMSKVTVSIKRLAYIMDSCEEPGADSSLLSFPQDTSISFKNVSFSYTGDGADVLRNVSLDIKAGETIGIMGSTGSGKSTLIHLLDRLYELPDNGSSITIGGIDIRQIDKQALRKNIGLVLQEPFLFSGTLLENLTLDFTSSNSHDKEKGIIKSPGSPAKEETDSRLLEAVDNASLTETIKGFKKGYATRVGERGVTLSGGQRQRSAIAQMLMKKPPIMIFDDSLSAVDVKTDAYIRSRLKEACKGATTIIISHRISTLKDADRIFIMEKGTISEQLS